jgi:hypothetical protein
MRSVFDRNVVMRPHTCNSAWLSWKQLLLLISTTKPQKYIPHPSRFPFSQLDPISQLLHRYTNTLNAVTNLRSCLNKAIQAEYCKVPVRQWHVKAMGALQRGVGLGAAEKQKLDVLTSTSGCSSASQRSPRPPDNVGKLTYLTTVNSNRQL